MRHDPSGRGDGGTAAAAHHPQAGTHVCDGLPRYGFARTMRNNPKWKRGDFYQLDTVEYRPESGRVRLRFRNNDIGEATTEELWRNRPGQPDWSKVTVDPETHGAILVPTFPGHPTLEREIAEIPGDLLRAATDVDYRAHVAN